MSYSLADAQRKLQGDALSLAMAQALESWPGLPRVIAAFEAHVNHHNVGLKSIETHGKDLYLAVACLRGDRFALQVLERDFLKHSVRVIAQVNRNAAFVDEARQEFLERLLVASPPAIGRYSGTGPLGAWLRVSALRTALNLKKADARWYSRTLDVTATASALDTRHHDIRHFAQAALDAAISSLNARERQLLRLVYLERRNLQSVADHYGTHRATIARWLTQSRSQLSITAIEHLREMLGFTRDEAQSEIALVYLGLDVTNL